MNKVKAMLLILCISSLLTSCGEKLDKELSKKEIIEYIEKIDTTNEYNYCTNESVLVDYKVNASDEYLQDTQQTLESLYEKHYVHFSEDRIIPQIGVTYTWEMPTSRRWDPRKENYIDYVEYGLSSGNKFYLKNDCLVEVIPMQTPNKGLYQNFLESLNIQYSEDMMIWIDGDSDYFTGENILKIESKNKETIVLIGEYKGYVFNNKFAIQINEETNQIISFNMLTNYDKDDYFGENEISIIQKQIEGFNLNSDKLELEYIARSTISSRYLEEAINTTLDSYKNKKESIEWNPIIDEREEYIIELHIDKEGYMSVFNQYSKVDYYQRGVWCYSIEVKIESKIYNNKWVEYPYGND